MYSSNKALTVENISKIYRIGAKEQMHEHIGSAIFDALKSPLKNFKKYRSLYKFDDIMTDHNSVDNNSSDIVWALKDISFDVEKGERLGIIGKNGAGKSTLLKILCRVTDPTKGIATIHGRVSSLLEVGTGFHQELTGRENVYLNAVILGMKKKEVDRKFDEIVDFSGVEKFIDTPVKRFSSGMTVRLAFSVAAHLEPEILIVDEVLAVGDADFQKKCLNKMEDVGREGRTVLFVSHNMSAITRLCDRAILINDGKIIDDGPSSKVVNTYINPELRLCGISEWKDIEKAPGDDFVRLRSVKIKTEDGRAIDAVDIRNDIFLEMEYDVLKSNQILVPYFFLFDQNGTTLFGTLAKNRNKILKGTYKSEVKIPGNFLSPGMILVNAYMMSIEPDMQHFRAQDVISFDVIDSVEGDTARGYYRGTFEGAVRPLLEWKTLSL